MSRRRIRTESVATIDQREPSRKNSEHNPVKCGMSPNERDRSIQCLME